MKLWEGQPYFSFQKLIEKCMTSLQLLWMKLMNILNVFFFFFIILNLFYYAWVRSISIVKKQTFESHFSITSLFREGYVGKLLEI